MIRVSAGLAPKLFSIASNETTTNGEKNELVDLVAESGKVSRPLGG